MCFGRNVIQKLPKRNEIPSFPNDDIFSQKALCHSSYIAQSPHWKLLNDKGCQFNQVSTSNEQTKFHFYPAQVDS